jgi:hypothetical protein
MYSWATAKRTYESFPLVLRRPTDVDTPEHRQRFPHLAVVTHTFTERLPDGRPEPEYNHTLEDLDYDIVTAFDGSGVPILIETFGGERNYYFCVSPEADVSSAVAFITHLHPKEKLTWENRPNAGWRFLDGYAKDFF